MWGTFIGTCAVLLVGMAASPASARNCYPERKICGQDPYTYTCPPCRTVMDPGVAKIYRDDLDRSLRGLEKAREQNPDASIDGYLEGLKAFEKGIGAYRRSVRDSAATTGRDPS